MTKASTSNQQPNFAPEGHGFRQRTLADLPGSESSSYPEQEVPGPDPFRQKKLPSLPLKERSTREGIDPARTKKLAADTVEGCRERAVADAVLATQMGTLNGRLRLEHSAARWTTRADLLQRLKDNFEARAAALSVPAARV
jgi:hypothetical protein